MFPQLSSANRMVTLTDVSLRPWRVSTYRHRGPSASGEEAVSTEMQVPCIATHSLLVITRDLLVHAPDIRQTSSVCPIIQPTTSVGLSSDYQS